ncbi:MAG: Long-chain-fatty-acid--CoA ligase [Burkholderiaceae bacterium]|jgi:acyl-CoA synthetase (AMP-forming)/AMP-acid ligase II|nr:MAG: Long-chain-fatty-acid--CoA ligase [Burkholderiaceae bacterium]
MNPGATTVRALIERSGAAQLGAPYALAADDEGVLYHRDLAASCRQVTALLRAQGLGPGDTVSVVMPNGLNTLRILLGALWGGYIVNPVNLLSQPEQMRYVLDHSDCRLAVVAPEWEQKVRALIATLDRPIALLVADPAGTVLPGESATDKPAADARHDGMEGPDADAVALLMYTSGTTGVPKGVMLTQSNLVANARAISEAHELGANDRVLAVLPLYHINAFVVAMLAPLVEGGSLAVAPKFSAGRFWAQAIGRRCTWLNVVPTIISYLLDGEAPARTEFAALRFCRSASAALPPDLLRAFEQRFGIGVIETMGLTETAAPSFSNPLSGERRRLGSVGLASGCEARVVDAQLKPLAAGESGEIVIRGPNVMRGYYKNDTATKAAFTPDGWLRTGDLGHQDADGYFFVTGRIKELIIKGGENIAPREIDEALLRHPAVLEAAAVGMPDRHYGQEILACVVLRGGAACSAGELTDFCIEQLGRYKTPKTFRFVMELPRGPSGKVQRLKLLDAG